MVVMKNITYTDGLISMDCYKEGIENEHFFVTINAYTNEIVTNTLGKPSIYVRQAVSKVLELHKSGELPSEAKSIWCYDFDSRRFNAGQWNIHCPFLNLFF